MKSVNPMFAIALALVLVLVVAMKLANPHKKYSTQHFWRTATVADVHDVPDDALKPGNANGAVLMWAATATDDPQIIKALVSRGADVREVDPEFSGTPLSGAAGYSSNPAIVKMLIDMGADVNDTVGNQETPLMVAARYNSNVAIFEQLIALGAQVNAKNKYERTALDLARRHDNAAGVEALAGLTDEQEQTADAVGNLAPAN